MKNMIVFVFVIGCGIMLCSCGRKSKPEAPKDSFYPHAYIITQGD